MDLYTLGYNDGRRDVTAEYEIRLAALWTELVTLNARLDRIETLLKGTEHE